MRNIVLAVFVLLLCVSLILTVPRTTEQPDSTGSAGSPETNGAVCVGSFDIQLGPGLEDLFAIAPNPLESLRLSGDTSYRLVVELESADSARKSMVADLGHNAFRITMAADKGRILASDRAAVFYAIDELARNVEPGSCEIRLGEQSDGSKLAVRALHYSLKRLKLDVAKSMIDRARSARFNTVIVHVADAVNIDSRIVMPRDDALSKSEFKNLVAYARANGLDIVPGLALLTHQKGFFNERFPELMYNYATYDPRNPKVYELVFAYLDELQRIMQPGAVLIGHDEVKGLTGASRRKWLKEGELPLPPELFLMDVKKLNDYLVSKDVGVWMWGDMLIAHEEFPAMHKKNFHGTHGYKELRGKVPTNILIIDWHYHHETADFPSAKAFADDGYDVLGSTWKNMNNIGLFANYVANMESGGRGMVATTFFHVQRRQWDLVDQIIQTSGREYWQAGRD